MGEKIKVGIIGQGRSGYDIHGRMLQQLADLYEIVAVSDFDEGYRKRAVENFGCRAYENYQELLEQKEIELIVNASPSHLHKSLSIEAMEKGFDVLCEKPLASSVAEVDEMLAVSEATGKRLTVFQQSRFAPAFQQIMSVVKSGVLGRIVQVSIRFNGFARRWDWQTLKENNGGSLLNTGPHPVDQALQLFGTDTMPDVFCKMDLVNTFGDAEDYVKLIMSKEGRPLIDLEISSCDAYPNDIYRIQGQYGGLSASLSEVKWRYFDPQKAPKQELIRTPLKNPDGSPAYCREELPWQEDSWTLPAEQNNMTATASAQFYQNLYQALREGGELEVTAQHVRQQIAVIEECHRQNP